MKLRDLIEIIEPETYVSYPNLEPMKFEDTPIKFLKEDISKINVGLTIVDYQQKGAIIIEFSNFTF